MEHDSGPPLESIRVLDLSRYVSGPYCTRLLADYGASVLKVEPPDGDPMRGWPPFLPDAEPPESLFFLYLNHGKETVALDLASNEGRQRLLDMAKDADVVVENFRPGTLDRLGLGWDALHAANPRLVLTSITAFGQTGPYRDFKAWDIVADAMGGLAYLHGYPDREPLTHGNPQPSYRGGVMAAAATLAALLNVDDEGEHVDVSIAECVTNTLRETLPQYAFTGGIRMRRGSVGGGQGQITPCADGYVIPSGIGSADWSTFARFMEAPELDDERFATGDGRQRHAAELAALLGARLKTWSMMHYFESAQLWGMGSGVVMNPRQVLQCEQLAERGFFKQVATSDGSSVPVPRGPVTI